MELKCPNLLKEYAQCVINKQNDGVLVQDACVEQFRMVMDCFKSVRWLAWFLMYLRMP